MKVKKGNIVTVEYEGRLESGEIFDSSNHGDHSHPLEFKAGAGEVIPGFDSAVIGMSKEEEKEFTILPKDAYGPYNSELKQEIPRDVLRIEKEPEVGMMLGVSAPDGRQAALKIIAISKKTITVDMNPPLAGKKLIFKIKVIEIQSTSEKEDTRKNARIQ